MLASSITFTYYIDGHENILMRMPLAFNTASPLPQSQRQLPTLELSVMSQKPEKAQRPDKVAIWLVLIGDVLAFGLTAALMGEAGMAPWTLGALMLAILFFLPLQWAAITYVKLQWWKIDNDQADDSNDSR
ncbi:MAG TPA: hypothetical protein VM581_02230 [Magnetospirillaceae bacterium]|nr:hypothetical protein [Magnetospirillaceae bacterium]